MNKNLVLKEIDDQISDTYAEDIKIDGYTVEVIDTVYNGGESYSESTDIFRVTDLGTNEILFVKVLKWDDSWDAGRYEAAVEVKMVEKVIQVWEEV